MENKMNGNERISALADGQLQGEAFALAVEAVCADRRGARDLARLPRGGRRAALGASQMPSGFLRNATFEGPTR
jgi:hypothetical protein